MLRWGLNLAYLALLTAAVPWLVYRRLVQKKPVAGFWKKFTGQIEREHPERPCFWFHAVSVGEVLQLPVLLARLRLRHPAHEFLVTTTTGTGYEVAKQKLPEATIAYWPLDFSWAVERALRTVRPEAVCLIELELWPNFLLAAQAANVPVLLINGRIGAKSARGYQRLAWLWRQVLPALTHCAVQTEEYARRLIALGVPAARVTVTGNIKYDQVEVDRSNPQTAELRRHFGLAADELVFIAGSTQETEEAAALDAWQALRVEFPHLRLILVPRHKERFEDVTQLVTDRGLKLRRRSQGSPESSVQSREPEKSKDASSPSSPFLDTRPLALDPPLPVCLLDTLGELRACWGLADVAFVGGSLTKRGGQNMLEPAAYGAAVLFGPNTWNFRDIVTALLECGGAEVVPTPADLTAAVQALLRDPNKRATMGAAAQLFVAQQQGALECTLAVFAAISPTAPIHSAGVAA